MVFTVYRFLKRLLILASIILFAQCTKISTEYAVAYAAVASPFTMPTNAYLALAKDHIGYDQQSLIVMAAGRAIYDGQWQAGLDILKSLSNLPDDLVSQKKILLAKIALMRQQPREAISQLASVKGLNSLPEFYQLQYHEMLSTAYKLTGNAVEAVIERIQLDGYLHVRAAELSNRRAIWLMLITLPKEELRTLSIESKPHSDVEGWAQLALIATEPLRDGEHLFSQIYHWQEAHSEHPAMAILPPYGTKPPFIMNSPRQVALLLPLSGGALAGPGQAIVDGFSAANKNSKEAIFIKMYDTAKVPAVAAYRQAIQDGADFVVGPLTKNDVASVAAQNHPVPTLLLNDTAVAPKQNALTFGLSPTYAAREVAVKMRSHGNRHALVLAPQGFFGKTVSNAFTTEFQRQGGHVVDVFNYTQAGLNTALRQFLKYKDFKTHKRNIQGNIPARRNDFDAIFLVGYPSAAREILPLLRYYDVRNIPVYATSSVYSGTPDVQKDKDLDGVIFCDIPWIFDHQMGNRHWPEPLNSYNRLYAIGVESYALAQYINQLLFFPAIALPNQGGILYLSNTGQIYHILEWRKFNQGVPELLQ